MAKFNLFNLVNKALNLFKIKSKVQDFDYENTARDKNMQTEPLSADEYSNATDYIEDFKSALENIYLDTKEHVEGWRDKSLSSEERQSRYMAWTALDRLDATYRNILSIIDQMVSVVGEEKTAKAIAQDVELDYAIALVFMPPSDVLNEMSITLEQVQGIFNRVLATESYENI